MTNTYFAMTVLLRKYVNNKVMLNKKYSVKYMILGKKERGVVKKARK